MNVSVYICIYVCVNIYDKLKHMNTILDPSYTLAILRECQPKEKQTLKQALRPDLEEELKPWISKESAFTVMCKRNHVRRRC